jgi:hypothetical protein
MALHSAIFDGFCYTILSLLTVGTICVFLGLSMYFVWTLDLTAYDTDVIVWLFVAFAISVVVLFVALYLNCCRWRYSKLFLAILYTLFDLFLLLAAVSVFTFRSQVIEQLEGLWTQQAQSSIVRYFEKKLKCCGFKNQTNCNEGLPTCFTRLEAELTKYSGWIGAILIALFVILLAGVVIAYYRSCVKATPDEREKEQELSQIQEQLNEGGNVWF